CGDASGSRVELPLNAPAESEVNRRLAAGLAGAVPGRGLSPPGVHVQLVLPRLDGEETAEGVREAQDDGLTKIAAAWPGDPAPPVRMLPHRLSAGRLRDLHPTA